ncbi:MAG: carbamoyl-phosphate synthase large subunit, partial [Thermoplasmatales archaeon]
MKSELPRKVLIIGSGPIVIGQSAEFDYSGNQAIKAITSKGVKAIVVNSNPATIQTDKTPKTIPRMVPLNTSHVMKIIEEEKPDAIMGTFGGQTGLNIMLDLWRSGFLDSKGIKVLGTSPYFVDVAEDRLKFKKKMMEIGEPVLESYYCSSLQDS